MTGTFTPAPGRAPARRRLWRQTRFEVSMTARRSEAVVLSLGVPVAGMLAAGLTDVIRLPTGDRLGYVVPGAIALAVMATAFTSQAISVGYERFYGGLKRFGASSLGRGGLLTSKSAAVGGLVLAQSALLAGLGVAIGWRPQAGQLPAAVAVTLLATVAYSGFAFVLASRLRPETTTALATLLYTLLLIGGGVMFPAPQLDQARFLVPLTAHAEALRATLTGGDPVPGWSWISLVVWAVVAVLAAVRSFRWE